MQIERKRYELYYNKIAPICMGAFQKVFADSYKFF